MALSRLAPASAGLEEWLLAIIFDRPAPTGVATRTIHAR